MSREGSDEGEASAAAGARTPENTCRGGGCRRRRRSSVVTGSLNGDGGRPQRARRPPRVFEGESPPEDKLLKLVIGKSLLETRRVEMDYSTLPSVPEVCFPSMEAFNVNPIAFFEGLRAVGREFGAVKIKPPPEWNPPFALQALLSDQVLFNVRTQEIHSLMHGKPFIYPETPFQASALRKRDAELRQQVFGSSTPSVETVEATYWKSVERGSPQFVVHYAADLKTNELGSGFPTLTEEPLQQESPQQQSAPQGGSLYASHPWNLSRLATSEGSLLRHYHRDVPGVTSPWLYLGMMFASFCWHTEDNFFAACNYHHWGEPKVWYVVPPSRAASVEKALQSYLANKDPQYVLHSLTVQLPPSLFVENGIPVYRMEQRSGEFVMLWPRTYHAGFNVGFNCNEACNFAPPLWLQWGHKAVRSYKYMRSTCVPYQQLLLQAAVHSQLLSASQQLDLCRALGRILMEEFGARRGAAERQLVAAPMQLSEVHVQKALALAPDVKGWQAELKSLVEFLKQFVCPLLPAREEGGNSCEAFLQRVCQVVALPVKDCTNCRACCVLSSATCPHTDEHVCLDCVDTLPCACAQRLVLVRVPLPSLRAVLEHCNQVFKTKAFEEGEREKANEDASQSPLSAKGDSTEQSAPSSEAVSEAEAPSVKEGSARREGGGGRTKRKSRSSHSKKRARITDVTPRSDKSRTRISGEESLKSRSIIQAFEEDTLLRAVPSLHELWNFELKTHGGMNYFPPRTLTATVAETTAEAEDLTTQQKAPPSHRSPLRHKLLFSTVSVRVSTKYSSDDCVFGPEELACKKTSSNSYFSKNAAAQNPLCVKASSEQEPQPPPLFKGQTHQPLGSFYKDRNGLPPSLWTQCSLKETNSLQNRETPLSLTEDDWKAVKIGGPLDCCLGRLSASQGLSSTARKVRKAKGLKGPKCLKGLEALPPEPVAEAPREEAVRNFVKWLSWRYILQTLREEEEDDDELILPMFTRVTQPSRLLTRDRET